MFSQIRKLITKIKGDDVFCSPAEEKYILKELKDKYNYMPFSFNLSDNKGTELLEFLLKLTKEMILKYNKSISNDKKKRKIYFFFVDDYEINAFATNIKNIDVIGINIGVLTQLYAYYNNVVGEKNFLEIEFDIEGRKDLLFNLQVMSVLYIICHEIGHLYNGHLDFRNLNLIKEVKTFNSNDRAEIIYNKTIELDADAFAMNRMLEFNEDLIKVKEMNTNNSHRDDIILDSYKKLLFSMYSFYLFFGETFKISGIKEDTYFSPSIRQVLNLTIAEEYISKERPSYEKKIKDLSDHLLMYADFTLDEYLSKKKSKKEKDHYLANKAAYLTSPEYNEEMLAVRKEWNTIRDDLQKYARFQLSPKYKL